MILQKNAGNTEVLHIIEKIFQKYIVVLESIDMKKPNPKFCGVFGEHLENRQDWPPRNLTNKSIIQNCFQGSENN